MTVRAKINLSRSGNRLVWAGRGYQPDCDFPKGAVIGKEMETMSDAYLQVKTEDGKVYFVAHADLRRGVLMDADEAASWQRKRDTIPPRSPKMSPLNYRKAMAKTRIIYHQYPKKDGGKTDCRDGIAAAWVARKFFSGTDIEMHGCVYPTTDAEGNQVIDRSDVEPGDRLVIVDFSFPKHVLDEWANQGCEIIVLDHHESAENALQGFTAGILWFDKTQCGATLTWDYFFGDRPRPAFLEYVQDGDHYNFDLPYSEEINEAISWLRMRNAQMELDQLDVFEAIAPYTQQQLVTILAPIGCMLLKKKNKQIADIAARHVWMDISGHKVPVVELLEDWESRLTSGICRSLYRQFPDAPFSACYQKLKTGEISWSFRSDKKGGNFHVGAIAQQFGGGGHHNAAGATVSADTEVAKEIVPVLLG